MLSAAESLFKTLSFPSSVLSSSLIEGKALGLFVITLSPGRLYLLLMKFFSVQIAEISSRLLSEAGQRTSNRDNVIAASGNKGFTTCQIVVGEVKCYEAAFVGRVCVCVSACDFVGFFFFFRSRRINLFNGR